MNKIEALYNFWHSFDLDAYDETAVPDNATLPYITYESRASDFNDTLVMTASLWYYGTSLGPVSQKALNIEQSLSRGGKLVTYDTGAFWIRKGNPFLQTMSDTNDMIRRIVLTVNVDFIGD